MRQYVSQIEQATSRFLNALFQTSAQYFLNKCRQTKKVSKFFYSPTDAQVNCLKNDFKIYIKIDIKTAPTCFGAVTPPSGSALLVLAKVKFVKIAN
jgi:hypothetical protein